MTVDFGRQRAGVLAIPFAIFGEDLFGRHVGAIIETEQDVAVRQSKVRPQRQCLAQGGFGFGEPALPHQGEPQIVVRVGVVRGACDGATRRVLRLLCLAGECEEPGQVRPRRRRNPVPGALPRGIASAPSS